ncbi:DUF768 domain-containing protein [Mesorhizobium sp. B2-3-14]|uniref:DUF768 domain-containing protein n=1 Tax=unclassified Mesorhizobium TaxID=325217 RepID=UPI00112753F1|nr:MULTISPECIES: DUF768 domain-containing protein [unclassified Mesorhizobium]TPK73835.1 DUF768 domain-containing protein [Mesorhizobium sp. B2-4-18]TPL79346.1 DUF768 domain-containing protein [Mesorhizobium sp. B2-3-14]TPL99637.1 DUF768 domain-containing protein [Mesorhizobium sp. B2-3-10]
MSSNLSGLASPDVISVAAAIQNLFSAAKAIGVSSTEIEATGSYVKGCSERPSRPTKLYLLTAACSSPTTPNQ